MPDQGKGSSPSQKGGDELPRYESLIVKTPLYKWIRFPVKDAARRWVENLQNSHFTIDAYCPWCGLDHTPFRHLAEKSRPRQPPVIGSGRAGPAPPDPLRDRHFEVELWCQRNSTHRFVILFVIRENAIQKAGQYPSFADLHTPEVEHLRSAFDDHAAYIEFKKALIAAANGYSVAAFAYFRRVFESLLNQTAEEARVQPGWDAATYDKTQDVPERIRLLADHLPTFLVERKEIYSILSEGIHKLTEDQCAAHFDLLKNGIEWILRDRQRQKEEKKLREETGNALQQAGQELFHGNDE